MSRKTDSNSTDEQLSDQEAPAVERRENAITGKNEFGSSGQKDDAEIQRRDVRALTERMSVLPLGGDIYSVTTESGSEYRVDALEGRCTCPDHQYRDVRCKHYRRVAFATGQWGIPGGIDRYEIDPLLGEHVQGHPRVPASDGGMLVDEQDVERPDDCQCWDADADLPCWPCYRAGFGEPNPSVTEED